MPLDLIRATSRANTFNPEARTVEVIAATAAPVQRLDQRGRFAESLDMATLDLSGLVGSPVLFNHRTDTPQDIVGVVEAARVEADQLIATLRLSSAADNLPVLQRVADGTLSGISIGYKVTAWRESTAPDGTRTKRPAAWSISEVTLTPQPADPSARVRTETTAPQQKDSPMLDETENTRRAEIRGLVRTAGLAPEIADQLIDAGADLTRAKAEIFDHVATTRAAAPIIRTHVAGGNDDPALITRRQSDAMAVRMAGGTVADDVRPYMGESMLDVARACLTRSGQSVRGMSADELLQRAAHTTSDFPLVVSNAMNKVALATYQAAASPLKSLARQRTLPNFKDSTSIRLGEVGRLEPLNEAGEITATSRAENGESFRLSTYARALNVSRELLINDDLGLLGDMTRAFAEAAAATEADIMVDLLTSNPALSDGVAVFHASRGNIGTGAGLTVGAVDSARKAMRAVKGLDGKTLVAVQPKYLLVGPELETEAEAFLTALYAATTADVNPFTGKLQLLVEPRITDDRWMIFADPARLPCLQYGYLSSAQGVQIQRSEAWDTLGMKFRAWLDFGAGFSDWRGAYLNPGL